MKKQYTPTLLSPNEYEEAKYGLKGLVMVDVLKCPICSNFMIPFPKDRGGVTSLFPLYHESTLEAQAERAGWRWMEYCGGDYDYICHKCKEDGKGVFTCVLCNEERTLSQKQESFGNPAEFLCKVCYETVSAKAWDEKVEELHDAHRYDFE